jgi:mono/diheme cytochrome c family protein
LSRAGGLSLGATLATVALVVAGCGTGGLASKNADKAHGKQLFQQKCASCHTLADAGAQGKIGPNLDDAFAGPRSQGFKESTIRNIVRDQILFAISNPVGVIKGPNGQEQRAPGMPQKLVTGSDAQDVAAYVASVAGVAAVGATTGATTTTAPPPPPPPATTQTTTTAPAAGGSAALLAQGKKVFAKAGCASCHTLKDAGATGTVGPDLDKLVAYAKQAGKPLEAFVRESILDPNAYVQPGYPKGVMPPFKGQLTPSEIDALVTYVSTVSGK